MENPFFTDADISIGSKYEMDSKFKYWCGLDGCRNYILTQSFNFHVVWSRFQCQLMFQWNSHWGNASNEKLKMNPLCLIRFFILFWHCEFIFWICCLYSGGFCIFSIIEKKNYLNQLYKRIKPFLELKQRKKKKKTKWFTVWEWVPTVNGRKFQCSRKKRKKTKSKLVNHIKYKNLRLSIDAH